MLYVPLKRWIEHSERKIPRHYPPENHRPLDREIRPFSDLSAHEESARKMLVCLYTNSKAAVPGNIELYPASEWLLKP